MKNILAFSIGTTPIDVPAQIQNLTDPTKIGFLGGSLFGNIIAIMLLVAIFMALGFIILGGFKWITSQGDPKQVEGARNTIIWASVGLGITFLSFYIVKLLGCFLNAPILGTNPCH